MKCIPKIKVHQNIVHAELKGGIGVLKAFSQILVRFCMFLSSAFWSFWNYLRIGT